MKKKISNFFKQFSLWNPGITMRLFFIIIAVSTLKVVLDNDIYFLLNTGKSILNNGIPFIETFTFHEGLSYISQQWLSSVIFYSITSFGGKELLILFVYVIALLISFLTYKTSMLVSKGKVKVSLFTTFMVISMLNPFMATRPQIFDVLLVILELYIIEKYISNKNFKILFLLPLISLLYINLHSSTYFILIAMYFIYFGEYIFNLIFKKKNDYNIIYLLIAMIISLGFSLINPYGIEAVTYLFRSFGVDEINSLVKEMYPLNIKSAGLFIIIIVLTIYSFYYNKGNNKPRIVFLFLGTFLIGLYSIKGFIYFIISSSVILSYNFKDLFKKENEYKKFNLKNDLVSLLVIFTLFGPIIDNLSVTVPKYYIELGTFIEEETKELDKNSLKVYTDYNTGGYFELLGYKCYIDPRAEVFLKSNNKKEDILKEYYYMQLSRSSVNDFLNKYNFDYLILSNNDTIYTYIQERNDYERIFVYDASKDKDNYDAFYTIYKKIK